MIAVASPQVHNEIKPLTFTLLDRDMFICWPHQLCWEMGIVLNHHNLAHNYFTLHAAVTVQIAAAQYSVAEDDGSVIITIRKNGLVAVPISITLTTIDGSAVGKLYLHVIQLLSVCWIIERVHMFIPTGLCC